MTEQELNKWIDAAAESNRQALTHVRHLAAEHNVDLHRWCVRRLRREAIRRTVLAACIFTGCCMTWSSSVARSQYDQITTSSDIDSRHICDTIRLAIENV